MDTKEMLEDIGGTKEEGNRRGSETGGGRDNGREGECKRVEKKEEDIMQGADHSH